MDKEKLTWRSFADGGAIGGRWHVSGTPSFFLVDHRGVIRHKWVGAPGARAVESAIEELLQEVERTTDKGGK